MKLISLNTWGGKYFKSLIDFIKQKSKDTEIFCLQEIYDTSSDIKQYRNIIRANLLTELKNILKDFQCFYFPNLYGFDDEANPVKFDLQYGPAIFVKNSIIVNSHNNYFIYKNKILYPLKKDFSNLATPLQYISFNLNRKTFTIFNFHGTPFPGEKLDSRRRLLETKRVKKIIENKSGAKILVGDFNLLPNTQSIKIFEKNMRNLIKEFNIQKTRSTLSPFSKSSDFQKFADYAFVTDDVNVLKFEVPEVEISDHLPMIVEFL